MAGWLGPSLLALDAERLPAGAVLAFPSFGCFPSVPGPPPRRRAPPTYGSALTVRLCSLPSDLSFDSSDLAMLKSLLAGLSLPSRDGRADHGLDEDGEGEWAVGLRGGVPAGPTAAAWRPGDRPGHPGHCGPGSGAHAGSPEWYCGRRDHTAPWSSVGSWPVPLFSSPTSVPCALALVVTWRVQPGPSGLRHVRHPAAG